MSDESKEREGWRYGQQDEQDTAGSGLKHGEERQAQEEDDTGGQGVRSGVRQEDDTTGQGIRSEQDV